ncbi:general odorant-binding protein 45-like [Uranotaenia lowii]|uniref:general odorant-binding protein 45-like n=1 Tax=Uranotaenia lowii TaxID=190385 RepID=UPI00247A01E1|nr:general odorant-binding protein 45-like [Uranotaenia lowii]
MSIAAQVSVVVVLGIAQLTSAGSPAGALVLKSLDTARSECKAYLGLPRNQCADLCETIVVRGRNRTLELDETTFGQHFEPDDCDVDYYNRTEACISKGLESIEEDAICCRASIESQCFRDQYGNVVDGPRMAQLTDIQTRNVIETCARMLQIEDLELVFSGVTKYELSIRSRCLLRCILIREGLYNDVDGPDLDRIYVLCGGYKNGKAAFKAEAEQCIAEVRSQCYDKCTMAARIVGKCFGFEGASLAGLVTPIVGGLVNTLVSTVVGLAAGLPGLGLVVSLLGPVVSAILGGAAAGIDSVVAPSALSGVTGAVGGGGGGLEVSGLLGGLG